MVLLQDFKIEFIIPIFMLAIGIGAYIGLEPIARVNNMFMPLAGIVLLLSLILLIPYFNINNIFPILGNGVLQYNGQRNKYNFTVFGYIAVEHSASIL